jgi:hypothetical protein
MFENIPPDAADDFGRNAYVEPGSFEAPGGVFRARNISAGNRSVARRFRPFHSHSHVSPLQ